MGREGLSAGATRSRRAVYISLFPTVKGELVKQKTQRQMYEQQRSRENCIPVPPHSTSTYLLYGTCAFS